MAKFYTNDNFSIILIQSLIIRPFIDSQYKILLLNISSAPRSTIFFRIVLSFSFVSTVPFLSSHLVFSVFRWALFSSSDSERYNPVILHFPCPIYLSRIRLRTKRCDVYSWGCICAVWALMRGMACSQGLK